MGVITVSIWVLAAVVSKHEKKKELEMNLMYTQQVQEEVSNKANSKDEILAIRDL